MRDDGGVGGLQVQQAGLEVGALRRRRSHEPLVVDDLRETIVRANESIIFTVVKNNALTASISNNCSGASTYP